MASLKEEIGQENESVLDTEMRDDGEDFILPSQPTSERSVPVVTSPAIPDSLLDPYLLPTVVDNNGSAATVINETILSVADRSMDVPSPSDIQIGENPDNYDNDDDLFGAIPETEPYCLDDSSLVQATPLFIGRSMVPETPAMVVADSEDDSFMDTPHLTLERLERQSPCPQPVAGTVSQLADTQPVQISSLLAPDKTELGGRSLIFDEFKVPETVNETVDSSIEEIHLEKKELNEATYTDAKNLTKEAREEKMNESVSALSKDYFDTTDGVNWQEKGSPLADRTLSVEKVPTVLKTPITESDVDKSTEPVPSPQAEDGHSLVTDANGERISAEDEADVETFIVKFQGTSRIIYDKVKKKILLKKFLGVKAHVDTASDGSELTDKSKRESMSSAGSVYSDKQDLPYKLKARVSISSNQTSSTSTVEENPTELTNGLSSSFDDQVAAACQQALAQHLQLQSGRLKRTPHTRLSRASKALFEKIQNGSFETSSREQSVDETLQPDLASVVREQKTTPLINENKEGEGEETDLVPPLPLVKSTPKRTRRPPRSKARGRASAVTKGRQGLGSSIKNKISQASASAEMKKTEDIEMVEKVTANDSSTKLTLNERDDGSEEEKIQSSKKPDEKHKTESTPERVKKGLPPGKLPENEKIASDASNLVAANPTKAGRKRPAKVEPSVELVDILAIPGPSGVKRPKRTPQKKVVKKEGSLSDNSLGVLCEDTSGDTDEKRVLDRPPNTPDIRARRSNTPLASSNETSTATQKKRGRRLPPSTPNTRARRSNTSPASSGDTSGGMGKKRGRDHTPGTPSTRPPPSNIPASQLQPGSAVFARWSDNFFYRGTITAALGNKWEVSFEDGNKKTIAAHFVVGLDLLREGHTVMVKNKDTYFPALIISSCISPNKYLVDVSGQEKMVGADQLGLTADQAKTLVDDQPPVFGTPTNSSRATVDPDNILSDRRRGSSLPMNSPLELIGSVKKKRKRSPVQFELTVGLESDETVLRQNNANPKSVTKNATKSRKKAEDMEKKLGPLPTTPIFAGFGFLLCEVKAESQSKALRTKKRPGKNATDSEISMSESEDASAYEKYEKFPFQAEWLKQQIIAGGGVVYDRFEDIPVGKYSQTRLVTNRPNRTAKFLLCLVTGVEIVLHLHIVEACSGKEFKSMKLLHAGWSHASKKWVDRPAQVQRTFNGRQIHVNMKCDSSDDEKRVLTFWNTVLKKAGANVVEQADYADTIVADSSVSDTFLEVLGALGDSAPSLVSPAWVIESIIHGNPLDITSHASFRHRYSASDSSS